MPSGYSTGALALGDFETALRLLAGSTADAVELSALRLSELEPLVRAMAHLDLAQYRYVSLHAPSAFADEDESDVIELLRDASSYDCHVVVHPDCIRTPDRWAVLGRWLCLENMDKRKVVGRTAEELAPFFALLPEAGLCLDIAHARQVDSSMTEAYRLITAFYDRIRQIHISEVSTSSRHSRISPSAVSDFREIAALLPPDAAVIVEAPVSAEGLEGELEASRAALSPATV